MVVPQGKEFLNEEQFQKLLSVWPNNFCGYRNKAWLWLLWPTDARFSELAQLKLSDLDWQEGAITVVGKGNKVRQVPFTRPAQRAVYQYLRSRKSHLKEDYFPELWISEERKPLRLEICTMSSGGAGPGGTSRPACLPSSFN